MRTLRSTMTTIKELDSTLVAMQNDGKTITQVFPCPDEMGLTGDDKSGYSGNFGTKIVILYFEKVV